MTTYAIDRVRTESGKELLLTEFPCSHCGKIGAPYVVVSEQGAWAFCSWECRRDGMRVDGQEVTPELMQAAGLHFINPPPDA